MTLPADSTSYNILVIVDNAEIHAGILVLQCLRELVRLDPTVKVIIASGYAANVHAEDILSKGAKAYLVKPYRLRELAAALREVLDAKGDPREE